MNETKVINFSQRLDGQTDIWKEERTDYSDPVFNVRTWIDIGDPKPNGSPSEFCVSLLQMGAHLGTHIDAPRHFDKDGATLDQLNSDWLAGWAVRVDLRRMPDADYLEWLRELGSKLRPGCDIPVVNWEGTLSAEVTLVLADWPCPLIVLASADVDCREHVAAGTYPNYRCLMKKKFLVVDLLNADAIQPGDFLVIAPLRLRGLEASPCRILALRGLRIRVKVAP